MKSPKSTTRRITALAGEARLSALFAAAVTICGLLPLVTGCGGAGGCDDKEAKGRSVRSRSKKPGSEAAGRTSRRDGARPSSPSPSSRAPSPEPKSALSTSVRRSQLPVADRPVVRVRTSLGDFWVVLFPERAPASTSRFLENVEARLYDGTIFHRVISSTLVQGGQYTPSLEKKKARAPIYCEARNGLSNMRGTVSMARLDREIDSARSQFFINLADNFHFDHRGMEPAAYGYAVFGRVFSGMDVVDRIGRATTEARTDLLRDVPTEPIEVIEMRRVR